MTNKELRIKKICGQSLYKLGAFGAVKNLASTGAKNMAGAASKAAPGATSGINTAGSTLGRAETVNTAANNGVGQAVMDVGKGLAIDGGIRALTGPVGSAAKTGYDIGGAMHTYGAGPAQARHVQEFNKKPYDPNFSSTGAFWSNLGYGLNPFNWGSR